MPCWVSPNRLLVFCSNIKNSAGYQDSSWCSETLYHLPHTKPEGPFRSMGDRCGHDQEIRHCLQLLDCCALNLTQMPFCKVESNANTPSVMVAPVALEHVQVEVLQGQHFVVCKPASCRAEQGKTSAHQKQAATFFSGVGVMDLALKQVGTPFWR
jgi:hypothetical protein